MKITDIKKSKQYYTNRITQKEVEVRVIFLRVGDIDTLNEKFFAEILVESKWEEPDLSVEFDLTLTDCLNVEEKELTTPKNYWNPKIYIENALNDPKQTVHYKIKKILIDVPDKLNINENYQPKYKFLVYEYKKIKGFFFEKLELNYFPIDVQDLSIIVTTFRSNKEVVLVQNKKKNSIVNSNLTIDQNIWHLYQHVEVKTNYEVDDYDYYLDLNKTSNSSQKDKREIELKKLNSIRFPVITFQCRAARRSGYFFWNAFFLIFLITSAVFTTFSIDCDKPHFRLPTTATLLLTSITFRWSYSSRCLPTVNYLTSLDKYSIMSLVLIYLCLIWHGFCAYLSFLLKSKSVHYLDRYFLAFLVLLYFTTHIILFIWLKSAYSIRNAMKDKDNNLFKDTKSTESVISTDTVFLEQNSKSMNSMYKRQSVFSTINNIDEINSRKKKSMMRNFSSNFKINRLSNLNEKNENYTEENV